MRWALAIALCGCSALPQRQVLTVLAASSLTEVAQDLESAFEADHPGVDVQVATAGSQTIRLQITQGAPADVFLSANEAHVDALAADGLVSTRATFAYNDLVLVVPADATDRVTAFDELPQARSVVLGTPDVPIGRYARQVLDRADPELAAAVRRRVVSEENNVRLVRAKVALGEADAAFVYRTDSIGVDGIRVVEIPAGLNVSAAYHAAAIRRPDAQPQAEAEAEAIVAFLKSDAARPALERRGFQVIP